MFGPAPATSTSEPTTSVSPGRDDRGLGIDGGATENELENPPANGGESGKPERTWKSRGSGLTCRPRGGSPVARRRPRQPARVSRSSGTLGDRHVPSGRDQRSRPASLGRAGLQGDAPGDGFVQAAVGGERRVVDLRDGRPDRLDLFLVTGLLAHPRGRLAPRRGRRQRLPHPAVEHAARRRPPPPDAPSRVRRQRPRPLGRPRPAPSTTPRAARPTCGPRSRYRPTLGRRRTPPARGRPPPEVVREVPDPFAERAPVKTARQQLLGDPRLGQHVHLLVLGREPCGVRVFEQVVEATTGGARRPRTRRGRRCRTCSASITP